MSEFYKYFRENMESLGLPAPETLYGSLTTAVGTAATILAQIDKYGKAVTIRELIVAGTRLEKLAVIGACSAAFYAGAVIGSIAVATGRTLSGGRSLSDVLWTARKHDLHREWLDHLLFVCRGIYQPDAPGRQHLRHYQQLA